MALSAAQHVSGQDAWDRRGDRHQVALRITDLVVERPVGFDDQTVTQAHEIDDVPADRNLPPELEPFAYFFANGCLVSTTSRSRSPATWV